MRIPAGCSEADHLGRRVTWGIIAGTHEHPEWRSDLIREWFLSMRLGRMRYMVVLYRLQGGRWGVRRSAWHIRRDHAAAWIATDGRA